VQDILLKLAWYEVGPHLAGHLAVHVMSGRDVTIWFHAKEVFHYLSIFTKSFVQFLLGPDIERALFPRSAKFPLSFTHRTSWLLVSAPNPRLPR